MRGQDASARAEAAFGSAGPAGELARVPNHLPSPTHRSFAASGLPVHGRPILPLSAAVGYAVPSTPPAAFSPPAACGCAEFQTPPVAVVEAAASFSSVAENPHAQQPMVPPNIVIHAAAGAAVFISVSSQIDGHWAAAQVAAAEAALGAGEAAAEMRPPDVPAALLQPAIFQRRDRSRSPRRPQSDDNDRANPVGSAALEPAPILLPVKQQDTRYYAVFVLGTRATWAGVWTAHGSRAYYSLIAFAERTGSFRPGSIRRLNTFEEAVRFYQYNCHPHSGLSSDDLTFYTDDDLDGAAWRRAW